MRKIRQETNPGKSWIGRINAMPGTK